MDFENINEVTASDLCGPSFNPETTYVLLERDIYPKTVKIKLSELKKWLTSDIR